MAKKKVQVLTNRDDGPNSSLWSLLEDQGFSVVAALERKSPRYKGQPRRKASPSDNPGRESGASPPLQESYEGTVKLTVVSHQHVRKMVNFVDQLRQNPGFRLLLMEATDRKDSVTILLGLREPTALGPALMAMAEVANVVAGDGPTAESVEPVLQVTLG